MNDEDIEQLQRILSEDNKFVIGIDPATKDGDKSVVAVKMLKNRDQDDGNEFVWADGLELSPEERMAKIIEDSTEKAPLPTHELTDEQLDAEMCMVSRTQERKQEVLDEIKLGAMRKGMERVNEEFAVELDESERADLKNIVKWKRLNDSLKDNFSKKKTQEEKTQEEKDAEGRRKEEEAMGKGQQREQDSGEILKSLEKQRDKNMTAKNKAFMAIARKAIKEKKGFGWNF